MLSLCKYPLAIFGQEEKGDTEFNGKEGRNLPPLPFFVAVFTKASHDLLLQIGDREALERRTIVLRRITGQKIDSLS